MKSHNADFGRAIAFVRDVLQNAADDCFSAGFSRDDILHHALEAEKQLDKGRLQTDPLFGPIKNGFDYARLFDRWRGSPPCMSALLSTAAEQLHIPADNPVFLAALMAGFAADVPSHNAYHDNSHFREVTAMMAVYADANQKLAASGDDRVVKLEPTELAKCLLAATAHDLGHDGKNNRVDDVYVPYRLEDRAIAAIEPFMALCGMSEKDQEDVRVMIRVTDVGANPGKPSPHQVLRMLMRAREIVVPAELVNLAKDQRLLHMAALMSDADLAPSAGLSYIHSNRQSRRLARENPAMAPTDRNLKGFLDHVMERGFTSPAGRHTSQAALTMLINKTIDRLARPAPYQPRKPSS